MIAGRHVIELVTEVAVAIVEETVEAQLAKSDRDNNDHPGTEEFSARPVWVVRWSQTAHLAYLGLLLIFDRAPRSKKLPKYRGKLFEFLQWTIHWNSLRSNVLGKRRHTSLETRKVGSSAHSNINVTVGRQYCGKPQLCEAQRGISGDAQTLGAGQIADDQYGVSLRLKSGDLELVDGGSV